MANFEFTNGKVVFLLWEKSLLLISVFSTNSLVFLQVQESNGISEANKSVLGNVADVVGSQVQVSEPMEGSQ